MVVVAMQRHSARSTRRAGDLPRRAHLAKLSQLAHVRVSTFLVRIRRSAVRSPFAPAVVLPHPKSALAGYLDERTTAYPGFTVTYLPSRSYLQGNFGSTFLGLLGAVSPTMLGTRRYAHARAGETVGISGVEASTTGT
jgi:cell division protein FtsI/penicillin-binding protein 2